MKGGRSIQIVSVSANTSTKVLGIGIEIQDVVLPST